MSEEKNTDVIASQDDYKYGFHDDNVKTVLETGKGLTEEIVRQISAWKMNQNGCVSSELKHFINLKRWKCQTGDQIYLKLISRILHIIRK